MKFISQRLWHTVGNPEGDYSCAHLTNRQGFESFLLEDAPHDVKIKGQTRIKAGFYELGIHNILTPLTIKHREAYKNSPWFKANPDWFHIEIMNVPEFTGIYMHSGVDDSHTDGCNLPCFGFDISKANNQGFNSLMAVDKFYSIVYPLLKAGTKVFIEIRDEILN